MRALRILMIGVLLVACAPDADDARSREYDLDCGDIAHPECENTAARFVADIRSADPDAVVIAVSFSDPGGA